MPKNPNPPEPNDRKRYMLNIWAGKEVGPEVESLAAREEEMTGHKTTKNGFARDLFFWALDRYREAGSLAKLKRHDPATLAAKNGGDD